MCSAHMAIAYAVSPSPWSLASGCARLAHSSGFCASLSGWHRAQASKTSRRLPAGKASTMSGDSGTDAAPGAGQGRGTPKRGGRFPQLWQALATALVSPEFLLVAAFGRSWAVAAAAFCASAAFRFATISAQDAAKEQDHGNLWSQVTAGVSSQLEDSARHSKKRKELTRLRILTPGDTEYVEMDAVRGSQKLRSELKELVTFVQAPERYRHLGVQLPRGVLFTGAPGTGKTYAARAVASESGVPFVGISGAELRSSSYVGQGSDLTIEIFKAAMQRPPCIIFIDEIDSVGRKRRSGDLQVQDSGLLGESTASDAENNVNALLALMEQLPMGVLVLAATNRPQILDDALLRAGRFDRRIEFRLPDMDGREELLSHHGTALSLAKGADAPDFHRLAKETAAFTPADLRAVLREAALAAARASPTDSEPTVTASHFEEAVQAVATVKARGQPLGRFQVIQRPSARLRDVQGCDDVVLELQDVVDFIAEPERFNRLGAALPRGILLEGPPGVGKTLAARALAGEAAVPFLSVAGSEFQASAFAGQGAAMVKELFELARSLAPSIVFLDEVDAVGRGRSAGAMGAQQDRENTLLQLLVEMDGFDTREEQVLVLAATNRAELLDAGLRRPGRLDRTITFRLPDTAGREAILRIHAQGKVLGPDVDLAAIARQAVNFSGAELRNVLNEAALRAGRRRAEHICQNDLLNALQAGQPQQPTMGFLPT